MKLSACGLLAAGPWGAGRDFVLADVPNGALPRFLIPHAVGRVCRFVSAQQGAGLGTLNFTQHGLVDIHPSFALRYSIASSGNFFIYAFLLQCEHGHCIPFVHVRLQGSAACAGAK